MLRVLGQGAEGLGSLSGCRLGFGVRRDDSGFRV